MRRTSLIATLSGVLSLAMGTTPGLAQWDNPPIPGIPGPMAQPAIPYPANPGGYPAQPVNPYPGGYGQPVNPYVGSAIYPIPPSNPYGGIYAAAAPGPSPVVTLADQLIAQADAFLQAFVPTSRIVPEGGLFIADTMALRDAAIRFRQAAATGAPPAVLSAEFQNVQAGWQRLNSRMFRVSRGRIGPNIATALRMGRTIEQIRGLP